MSALHSSIDVDEKNYITHKRGNHGLGILRVKAVADKYGGYLNLAKDGSSAAVPPVHQLREAQMRSVWRREGSF